MIIVRKKIKQKKLKINSPELLVDVDTKESAL